MIFIQKTFVASNKDVMDAWMDGCLTHLKLKQCKPYLHLRGTLVDLQHSD